MAMRELLEQRARTAAAMREIVDHPADGGDLSEDQQRKFDVLKDELQKLEQRIERQSIVDDADRRMAGVPVTGVDTRWDQQVAQFSLCRAIAAQIEPRSVDAGREIEVSQELQRRAGRAPRRMLVPLSALVEKRVLLSTEGSPPSAGSSLTPLVHSSDEFIDVLRPMTITGQLGARMLTGLRGDLSIPKMTAGPAVQWVAENQALTEQDYDFNSVTGTPRHAGLLTEWSRKVMLQADPAIEQLVRADFTQRLAAGVDLAVMKGAGPGSNQPLGIVNQTGVQVDSSGLSDWAEARAVVTKVEALDVPGGSFGWAANAHVAAKLETTLKTTADTSSNYIMGPDRNLAGFPLRVTSQLAGGIGSPNLGEAIFGAWNQVIVLFWGDSGADVLVNPFGTPQFAKGNVQVRAFVDCDVVVHHAPAFVWATTIPIP